LLCVDGHNSINIIDHTPDALQHTTIPQEAGSTHQVALVQQQQQVLVTRIPAYVLLQKLAARALRITSIQHLMTRQAAAAAVVE
jgi:hypothetical protein